MALRIDDALVTGEPCLDQALHVTLVRREEKLEGSALLDLAAEVAGGAEDQPKLVAALVAKGLCQCVQGELQVRGGRHQRLRRGRPEGQQTEETDKKGRQEAHFFSSARYVPQDITDAVGEEGGLMLERQLGRQR